MSGFKDMVAEDNRTVWMNDSEFAERRTIRYDGEVYANIPIVLSGAKQSERPVSISSGDHGQGLYLVSAVLHCSISDLGGKQPERGTRIQINDEADGGGFFREYYVAASDCEVGMLRVELEAIDE
ncbi:MAG: hypothetical protein ACI4AL_06110 [Aristaeellaceae bacterium]